MNPGKPAVTFALQPFTRAGKLTAAIALGKNNPPDCFCSASPLCTKMVHRSRKLASSTDILRALGYIIYVPAAQLNDFPSVRAYLHLVRRFEAQNVDADVKHVQRQRYQSDQRTQHFFVFFSQNLLIVIKHIEFIGDFINE